MKATSSSRQGHAMRMLWLLEAVVLSAAFAAAVSLRYFDDPAAREHFVATAPLRAIAVPLFLTGAMMAFGLYQVHGRLNRTDFLLRLTLSFSFGGVALLGVAADAPMPESRVPLWRDVRGDALVEGGKLGRGRLMRFTRPLQPGAMPELLEPDFPRRLRALLEEPLPAPASARAVDHAPETGASAYVQPPRDLQPWLALLIALVFLAERWLATSPRRADTGARS